MAVANPYVVELRLTNENTREQKLETRTVYAYTVTDALMQAHLEAAQDAGSAKIDLVRVGPPEACYATDALQLLTQSITASLNAAKRSAK